MGRHPRGRLLVLAEAELGHASCAVAAVERRDAGSDGHKHGNGRGQFLCADLNAELRQYRTENAYDD